MVKQKRSLKALGIIAAVSVPLIYLLNRNGPSGPTGFEVIIGMILIAIVGWNLLYIVFLPLFAIAAIWRSPLICDESPRCNHYAS
jgi:hypothetical protein